MMKSQAPDRKVRENSMRLRSQYVSIWVRSWYCHAPKCGKITIMPAIRMRISTVTIVELRQDMALNTHFSTGSPLPLPLA